jgi:hypothetical protein
MRLRHKFITVSPFATVERCHAFVDSPAKLAQLCGAHLLLLFQKAQRFADDFAGGVIPGRW